MCGGNKLKQKLPNLWKGLCAQVMLISGIQMFKTDTAPVYRAKRSFEPVAEGLYIYYIGQPKGIPNEFKATNVTAA